MHKLFWPVVVSCCCSGCALLGKPKHGELTRRFESSSRVTNLPIDDFIAIKGYAFMPPESSSAPSKPKTFQDLDASVQRHLVYIYGRKDSSSAAVAASIRQPLSAAAPPPRPALIDDRTSFKKRIVLSVRNLSYNPADRIWKLFITLTKPAGLIRFSNSSALATDFETVDVGHLSFDRKSSFSTQLTAGSGVTAGTTGKTTSSNSNGEEVTDGESGAKNTNQTGGTQEANRSRSIENKVGGSINFGSDFSSKEEVNLKQRFVKLSASVSADSFSLYQESTSGIDLSGNLVADVEFSYSTTAGTTGLTNQFVFTFDKLKTGTTYAAPAAVSVQSYVVLYPSIPNDIYATITFEGVFRQVVGHDNTIAESDDQVNFIGGKSTRSTENVLLLTRDEVTPKFWNIVDASRNPVRIQSPSLGMLDLVFRSYEDAEGFLDWLKTQRTAVRVAGSTIGGNYSLSLNSGNLTEAAILGLSLNRR